MKVFCVISLAALIYQTKPQEPSRSETLERLRSDLGIKAMTVCIAKEGGTDADVDGFLEGVVPYTKIEQCLNSCLGRKIGIVSFCLTSMSRKENLSILLIFQVQRRQHLKRNKIR